MGKALDLRAKQKVIGHFIFDKYVNGSIVSRSIWTSEKDYFLASKATRDAN